MKADTSDPDNSVNGILEITAAAAKLYNKNKLRSIDKQAGRSIKVIEEDKFFDVVDEDSEESEEENGDVERREVDINGNVI